MRRAMLAALFASSATGCATMSHKVKYDQLDASPTSYVVDETKPDAYPRFFVAEGNIYSCRYGIHFQSRDEFEPPKTDVFAKLLAKQVPQVASRRVVLQRFDVYYNHRLKAVATGTAAAGGAVGGALGESIRSSGQSDAAVNRDVFTFGKIIIDPDPLRKQDPRGAAGSRFSCTRDPPSANGPRPASTRSSAKWPTCTGFAVSQVTPTA